MLLWLIVSSLLTGYFDRLFRPLHRVLPTKVSRNSYGGIWSVLGVWSNAHFFPCLHPEWLEADADGCGICGRHHYTLLLVSISGYLPQFKCSQIWELNLSMGYRWLPESPRWLLVKERYDEIVNIFILRAAKVNRLDISAITDSAHQQFSNMAQDKRLSSPDKPTESFLTMMKIRTLLKRQLIMCYTW